jgi:hypothetical protein
MQSILVTDKVVGKYEYLKLVLNFVFNYRVLHKLKIEFVVSKVDRA